MPCGRARRSLLVAAFTAPSCTSAATGCRRRVYVDLGANWANTLRLHYKLKNHIRHRTLSPDNVSAFNNCTYEWEVYAFEASPIMQPFVEAFVKFLNHQGERPVLKVPPIGGSLQMLGYARHFGCPFRHNRSEYARMYACMYDIFREPYQALTVEPALNDSALVQHRMDEAALPNTGSETRFTFIPAAVGDADGVLHTQWPAGLLLYVEPPPTMPARPVGVPEDMYVTVVDFVQWLKKHFTDTDLVLVKMDVEGAEHGILRKMLRDRSISLIDVLGLECHGDKFVCEPLLQKLHRAGVRLVSEHAYSPLSTGVDPFSHMKHLMPIDPRKQRRAG